MYWKSRSRMRHNPTAKQPYAMGLKALAIRSAEAEMKFTRSKPDPTLRPKQTAVVKMVSWVLLLFLPSAFLRRRCSDLWDWYS